MLNGTIAGSNLTINKAVYNIIRWLNLPVYKAIQTVTINPAKLLGLSNSKGKIKSGYDADIIAFSDDLKIKLSVVNGKVIYKNL